MSMNSLTIRGVARACKVAPGTVEKWVENGRLLSYRVPGNPPTRRIPRTALVRFLKEHGMTADLP